MIWLTVFLSSILGGIVQAVTGFGCGVVMMLFLPQVMSLISGSAVVAASSLGLTGLLTWQYRKDLHWKMIIFPTIIYLSVSVSILNIIGTLDISLLKTSFCIFLLLLALYLLLLSSRAHLKANTGTMIVCSAVSGAGSGLFAIGGPLMALYFLDLTKNRDEYIANLEAFFFFTAVVNTATRVIKGIFTVELLGYALAGLAGIVLGKQIGAKIAGKMNAALTRKVVYVAVGLSGLLILIQQLF